MRRVGLSGGIGSGKSTVARLLVARGAVLVDGDVVAREVLSPGAPALTAVIERFGPSVRRSDGSLDRAGLAGIVFSDPDALAALNTITGPPIGARIEAAVARAEEQGRELVVLDLPLLDRAMIGRYRLDLVVIVDVDPEVAVHRLVEGRGFAEGDARARLAAQMGRVERRALADVIIPNDGSPADLEDRLAAEWPVIQGEPLP